MKEHVTFGGLCLALSFAFTLATERGRKKIVLTSTYWDCECETEYIHKSTPQKSGFCGKCSSFEEDQPDSHLNEVVKMLRQGVGQAEYYVYARHTSRPLRCLGTADDLEVRRLDPKSDDFISLTVDAAKAWAGIAVRNSNDLWKRNAGREVIAYAGEED